MRVVVLDALLPERLGPRDRADAWQGALHAGGYLLHPGAAPGPAAEALRGVHHHLAGLAAAEANVTLAGHPIGWLTGTVPRPVVGAMVVSFVGVALVGQLASEYGGLLVAMGFTPILWSAFALVGLAVAVRHELRRRELLAASEALRRRHAQELTACVRQLAWRTAVLRTEGSLLVSAPHHTWLTHRLRDLRLAWLPDAPPTWRELMDGLRARLDVMDAALRAAAAPDAPLPDPDAFTTDVGRLLAAFSATGARRGAEGAALADAVERAATRGSGPPAG